MDISSIKKKFKEYIKDKINSFIKNDLKDLIKSDTVVLLCNGPSLNSIDFSKVDYPLIGLNKIYLKKSIQSKIDVVVSVDKYVLKQMTKSKEARSFHTEKPIILPSHRFWLKVFFKKSFFIPIKNDDNFYSREKQYYGTGHTVTYVALQILFHLGVKTVYVVGMDHNFKHRQSKGVEVTSGNDINHFDPNYFKNQKTPIGNLEGSEKAYAKALKNYNMHNKEIINVGPSLYNGWPKINLEELYEECRKG